MLEEELLLSDSISDCLRVETLKKDSIIALEEQRYLESVKIQEQYKTFIENDRKKLIKYKIGVGVGSLLFGTLLGLILLR